MKYGLIPSYITQCKIWPDLAKIRNLMAIQRHSYKSRCQQAHQKLVQQTYENIQEDSHLVSYPHRASQNLFSKSVNFPLEFQHQGSYFSIKSGTKRYKHTFFHAVWLYEVPWCQKCCDNTKIFTPHIFVKLTDILHCVLFFLFMPSPLKKFPKPECIFSDSSEKNCNLLHFCLISVLIKLIIFGKAKLSMSSCNV